MAELSKKLHVKNTAGVTQDIKLYSTTNEVGSDFLKLKVDGVECYAPIATDGDTSLCVKKNGITYKAKNEAVTWYVNTCTLGSWYDDDPDFPDDPYYCIGSGSFSPGKFDDLTVKGAVYRDRYGDFEISLYGSHMGPETIEVKFGDNELNLTMDRNNYGRGYTYYTIDDLNGALYTYLYRHLKSTIVMSLK